MKKISICIFIPNIDKNTGGPSRSVPLLARGLSIAGADVTILTHRTEQMNMHLLDGCDVHVDFLPKSYKKSDLRAYFSTHKFDFLQGESMWIPLSHDILNIAKKYSIPFTFVPRGSLEPWSLKQKWLKKKLAMILYQKKDIQDAACILATADMERDNLRKLGFTNPIAVIPNGIDISEYPCRKETEKNNVKKQILFLSRIHPKKGIELLIDAWQEIHKEYSDWNVVIAGNGEEQYITQLKTIIKEKGLGESMKIVPPIFGMEKYNLYKESSLFILPTYSENFGMVIAEALACGVPAITTKNAPWKILVTEDIGWWIDLSVNEIKKTLKKAMSQGSDKLFAMGQKGSKVVYENYYYVNTARRVFELYVSLKNDTLCNNKDIAL